MVKEMSFCLSHVFPFKTTFVRHMNPVTVLCDAESLLSFPVLFFLVLISLEYVSYKVLM